MLRMTNLFLVLAFLLTPLLLVGCEAKVVHTKVEPATKEKLESGIYRLTLTERAIERIDVQTTEITTGSNGQLLMPYSALIYDLYGDTWAYTNPEPRVFVREAVTVDVIEGDWVHMTAAPQEGTLVVTVAAAELYGAETGIGK